MSSDALHVYTDALWQARPELRLALPYLRADERDRLLAFACLEQQWVDSVYGITEPSVLAAKLGWWRDELTAARDGHTHHPLGTALFADGAAATISPTLWNEALDAGLAIRECTPPATFAEQLATAESFHGKLASLETHLWFGAKVDPARSARLVALGHLLAALLHVGSDGGAGAALPMNLLARHQLARTDLAQATTTRDAAIRDQLSDLHSAFIDAMSLPGSVSLFRTLGQRADQQQLRAARASRQPLRELATARRRLGLRMVWHAWQAGRGHRRAGQSLEFPNERT